MLTFLGNCDVIVSFGSLWSSECLKKKEDPGSQIQMAVKRLLQSCDSHFSFLHLIQYSDVPRSKVAAGVNLQ